MAAARTRDLQHDAGHTTAGVRARDDQPALLETTTVIATYHQPEALPASATKELFAPTNTGETAIPGGESATDSGKPASVRQKAYSSIDAQTLAAARVRGEVLAGKRGKVADSAQLAAAPENHATAIPPAVADEPASRTSGSSVLPLPSLRRFDAAQTGATELGPPPRAAAPSVKSTVRDSPVGSPQNLNARSVLPQLPGSRAALPRTPASRVELAQTSPSAREWQRVTPTTRSQVTPRHPNPFEPPRIVRLAPIDGTNGHSPLPDNSRIVRVAPANRVDELRDRDAPVILGYARSAPSSPRQEVTEITGAQRRVVNAHAAPSRPQQDAAAAQLDDSWERRERWLRERLQTH